MITEVTLLLGYCKFEPDELGRPPFEPSRHGSLLAPEQIRLPPKLTEVHPFPPEVEKIANRKNHARIKKHFKSMKCRYTLIVNFRI